MCSTDDRAANFAQARALIESAAGEGVSMLGLPECFSFLGHEKDKLAQVDAIADESEAFIIEVAREFNLTVLGGGHAVPAEGGKAFNRALLAGPEGVLAQYDKMHLFDVTLPDRVYRESAGTVGGEQVVTWDGGPLGVHGLAICYDMRFPELFRAMSKAGAEVLWIPAAFTVPTGKVHWEVLLRARAIENTCYVIAPAQVGEHGANRASYGHALVVDPWGSVLADGGGDKPGYVIADLSGERLGEVRSSLPSLTHRRM